MRKIVLAALACVGLLGANVNVLRADEIPGKYKPCINKGLDWLGLNGFPIQKFC